MIRGPKLSTRALMVIFSTREHTSHADCRRKCLRDSHSLYKSHVDQKEKHLLDIQFHYENHVVCVLSVCLSACLSMFDRLCVRLLCVCLRCVVVVSVCGMVGLCVYVFWVFCVVVWCCVEGVNVDVVNGKSGVAGCVESGVK